MQTAIIIASTHGTTEKTAQLIKNQLPGMEVEIINLKENKNPDISLIDTVVIGGSIHAGKIQKTVQNFCKKNLVALLDKKVGLFICCMNRPHYQKQLEDAFPELLRRHAFVCEIAGGEFLFEKMNFFEKFLVRKISGFRETTSCLDNEIITEIAQQILLQYKTSKHE